MKKEAMRHLLWLSGLLIVIILVGAIWGGRLSEKYEEAAQQETTTSEQQPAQQTTTSEQQPAQEAPQQATTSEQQPAQETTSAQQESAAQETTSAPEPAGPSCPATPANWIPKGSYLNGTRGPDGALMKCECNPDTFASRVAGANTTGCDAISCVCREDPATIPERRAGRRVIKRTPVTMNNTLFLNLLNVKEDICVNPTGRIIYRNDMKADTGACPAPTQPDENASEEELAAYQQKMNDLTNITNYNKNILREVNAVINASGAGATEQPAQQTTTVEAYHNIEPFANQYASCY